MSLKDKYAIVGVGYTQQGKIPGRSASSFFVEAAANAIKDAGLKKEDIDGVLTQPGYNENVAQFHSMGIARLLGIAPRFTNQASVGGATCNTLVHQAAMAIDAGLATNVVCVFGDNAASGANRTPPPIVSLETAYGQFGAAAGYGQAARRHMHLFGTTQDQLGAIAVAFRKNAEHNPIATMRKPLSLEDYHNSRWVVEPFHLLDCCLVSDGGAAVVVTSAERAKDLKQKPVYIMGMGQSAPCYVPGDVGGKDPTGAKQAGETAFNMAGITSKDVNICELYDCFTFTALVTLEDYGFCNKGEGGAFVEGGRLEIGGSLPTNTAGGLLSESYMTGMLHLVEATRQLRGTVEPERQVKNAGIALVSGNGGILASHSTTILRS